MTEVFELPSLGADMESGVLLEWYVAPGDCVERGSVVALVSTDKADIDIEIWQSGIVEEILVDVDAEIPVGTPILRLGDELADQKSSGREEMHGAAPVPAAPAHTPAPASSPAGVGRLRASPFARAAAEERGIDLRTIEGSGPGGAIVIRDIDSAIVAAPARTPVVTVPVTETEDRAAAMRRTIAARMATANTEIPHYYLEQDIDLEPMMAWLVRHNAELPVAERVLPAAVLLKATAIAAAKVPELNGFWLGGRFEPAESTDLAVVVSLRGGGVVTPRLRDVAELDVDEVMGGLTEIVLGARRGSLRSSWMVGAGLTVTNLGERGTDRVSGVIFPPQVALVGFGAIRDRPWVVDGRVMARPVVTASLAADHRATDGAVGSRFLSAVAKALQNMEAI